MLPKTLSNPLDEEPHRLAGNLDEALHPQHAIRLGHRHEAGHEAGRIGCGGDIDDEAVEVIVIMPGFGIVAGGAIVEVVFRRCGEPEKNGRVDPPFAGFDDLHGARDCRLNLSIDAPRDIGGHQVALVQNHDIGAEQLVLIDLFQRVLVVDRAVRGALCGKLRRIVGEAPVGA